MNSRERFIGVAHSGPVDRVPYFEEAIRREVLKRWHTQGLDKRINEDNYIDFFGLDRYEYIYLWLEPSSGRLETKEDVERLKKRYRDHPPSFRHQQFWRKQAKRHGDQDFPLGVLGWRGFMLPIFTYDEEWDSLVHVLINLHDHPDWMSDVLEFIADYYIETLELAFQHLRFDFGMISEPIASPVGPIISPKMFQEFILPCYRKIIRFFHENNVTNVVFRSTSNVASLLPSIIESGVDGIWINQIGSTPIDYPEIGRTYPNLLLVGGIDSTTLTRDTRAIEAELKRKVPKLLERGRFIPMLDDNPRENVAYQNYLTYRKLLRRMCE